MCHPAHGTKGYKSLFRVATHLVTAAFLSKAFCGNPFAMTSRFVCYGIRPRDRFSPSTDSLKHSCCRSFHHCQFLTLLYTHYFRNASLIYPDFFFQLYCTLCPGMLFCCLFHSPHGNVSHLLFICQQVFDFYRELL